MATLPDSRDNGKWRHYLTPLGSELRTFDVVGFDVEGTGEKEGFLLGVTYDVNGPKVYRDRVAMARALTQYRYRGARIFAHNLEYDWGCVFQDDTEGWSLYRLHSRLIRACYKDSVKHKWVFLDTGNLSYFLSLEAMGRILGYEKLNMPDWLTDRGGVTVQRGDLSTDRWADLERYCIRDAEICYRYACFIQDTVNALGGELKSTLPSTAMDIFRRAYLEDPIKTPHKWVNDLCRQAYYGGRCEVFRYGTLHNQYHYDVHSMYPAAMLRCELPDPAGLYLYQHNCSTERIHTHEGITHCEVVAPESHIPLLPTRIEGRLLFTTGRFEGAWCHNELRRAIELGYQVVSIDWQLCTREVCNPLQGYVEGIYKRKVQSQAKGDPSYYIFKLLLNSLYGKFGQRSDGGLTRLRRCDEVRDYWETSGQDVIFWQDDIYVIEPVAPDQQPSYVIVLWAAYVTAQARLQEYELLTASGMGVAYGDTDCAVSPMVLKTGEGIGELGLERGPVTYEFRAPKYYRWRDNGSDWSYKTRGIHRDFQREFWETGSVLYRRPTKIGEALKSDTRLSRWIIQLKTDSRRHLKRCPLSSKWIEGQDISTRPWTYNEAVIMYEHVEPLIPWRQGRMLTDREVQAAEAAQLDRFQLRAELIALESSLVIPSQVIFELWDYRAGDFKRVRNKYRQLVLGAYARVDEEAQELGFVTAGALKEAIREQVKVYVRIQEIRRELQCSNPQMQLVVQGVVELPF